MAEYIKGTRDLAGKRTGQGPYVHDDGIDRLALARRNLLVMLGQGVPPSVVVGLLGKTLRLCVVCAREFEHPRSRTITCSRACANSLTGRANLGRKKVPMSAEHKQKISAANRAYAAVAARKIPGGADMSAPPDITSPQWRSVTSRIREQAQGRGGNCVQASTALFEAADQLGLVDAEIVGATVRRGGEHWWVESGGYAFDFSDARSTVMAVAEFRAAQDIVEFR